jgi:ABC-type transport system substrate-binding protein
MNITKRKSLYRNAQKILLEEEVGIAPLFFNTQIILNKPWIKNFEFNSMDLVFCEKISVGL